MIISVFQWKTDYSARGDPKRSCPGVERVKVSSTTCSLGFSVTEYCSMVRCWKQGGLRVGSRGGRSLGHWVVGIVLLAMPHMGEHETPGRSLEKGSPSAAQYKPFNDV